MVRQRTFESLLEDIKGFESFRVMDLVPAQITKELLWQLWELVVTLGVPTDSTRFEPFNKQVYREDLDLVLVAEKNRNVFCLHVMTIKQRDNLEIYRDDFFKSQSFNFILRNYLSVWWSKELEADVVKEITNSICYDLYAKRKDTRVKYLPYLPRN